MIGETETPPAGTGGGATPGRPWRDRPALAQLPPHLVEGVGLALALLVLRAGPYAEPTLGTISAVYALVLGLLAVIRWLPARIPGLFHRFDFVVPSRLRDAGYVAALGLASWTVASGWLALRGGEWVEPRRFAPAALIAALPLLGGLGVAWLAWRRALAAAFLFGPRLYTRMVLLRLFVPALGAGAALALYSIYTPAGWEEQREALQLLAALRDRATRQSAPRVIAELDRRLPALRRVQVGQAAARLLGAQPQSSVGELAVRLAGTELWPFHRAPATGIGGAGAQGSAGAAREAVRTSRVVPLEEILAQALAAHWQATLAPAAGGASGPLGTLGPQDAATATSRMASMRALSRDPVLRGWTVAADACQSPALTAGSGLKLGQEEVWLIHLLCSPDEATALARQREWVGRWFPKAEGETGPLGRIEGHQYHRISSGRVPGSKGGRTGSAWETPEAFHESIFQTALVDARQVDALLFGREETRMLEGCGRRGRLLHLWQPAEDGGAVWAGAVARLIKGVPPLSRRHRPLNGDELDVPLVQIYRARPPDPMCPAGWFDLSLASIKETSEVGNILGESGKCQVTDRFPVLCGFPAFVVEPEARVDDGPGGQAGQGSEGAAP
ncbi:MAG TPA: hypothetical protein VH877_21540 [Polyangia bacterium]|jgi:hypothetical protein|nr:hypothetical protein [Polyangia bacterium]